MKKKKNRLLVVLALALIMPATMMMVISIVGAGCNVVTPPRPEGPCDIYAAGGSPCVAAHSSTRALYASYNGPLYQVIRQSDGKTLDIGVVKPTRDDPGGYADAAAQDKFCANTYCWISILYDQSGKGNNLIQSPRGGAGNPTAMGGFNSLPIADMAPVTLMGHKVYGIFIEPGMGLRQDDPKGTAVDDQAEGQYWVINGHHYNGGCCFDYGNAEIDSRDDGDGTMETTYYGNAVTWYYGQGPGPWIMTDQENNIVGCVTDSPANKYCPDLPTITWRFVTATFDGEPGHWRTMGGDAQRGDLSIMFDGPRVQNEKATRPELISSYDPMRKQGAIDLGNGGDNGNWSQGTMYEGAMTAAGTFPTEETNQKVQANIVAAGYDVPRLSVAPANATDMPPGLQTFSPGSSQNTTLTFTNTTGAPVKGLNLSLTLPGGWKAVVQNSTETSKSFPDQIEPGASVNATFTVTSGYKAFNGDLVGKASWKNTANGKSQTETAIEKVRNVSPVKINEFRISDGSNTTNSFVELYNAGSSEVDISNWTLTMRPYQMPIFSSVNIPSGTKLASNGFYLLGLSTSGLAVPAKAGESVIYVRSTTGMSAGDVIEIGEGANMERRTIKSVGTAAGLPPGTSSGIRTAGQDTPPTVWQPLPEGPVITIPKGSTNVPVASVAGIVAGQKIGIGYGATYPVAVNPIEKYEVVTVTEVGKPGTQGFLSMDAKAGDTNIKVHPIGNISVGDKIRLDVESEGHGIEWVTVTRVGTQSVRNTFNGPLADNEDPGTGLDLAEPLKFNHSSNLPFACNGTGITFEPATAFDHSSNEPVLPLGTGITLDQPLTMDHEINSVIRDEKVTTAGYQGTPAPDQWFGGPAFFISAGNMVLRDAAGNVVDGLNYGLIVDPWAAEGYMGVSEIEASGCKAPSPRITTTGVNISANAINPVQPDMSTGRYPDGKDNDSNCSDFKVQNNVLMLAASTAGSDNIKVASVAGFSNGQKIIIDKGANSETAVIRAVGTPGATTTGTASRAGATAITVAGLSGFSVGQTITIGSGANAETATIATLTPARGRIGSANYNPVNSITFTAPLKKTHAMGAQVSGTGITLTMPLTRAHNSGAQVASNLPTPGHPNQY
ncbi:MAG TPA: arabinofuranosidase catalytic domain-containing protein [Bacteroidales bacterium]|nr:MAG: Alpha-L-arabinofuranosidase B, catalytic [Bacteroidetes bacterium ADurb.Bin145]HQG62829.1 arabinofuranosidase catalytic domain-containing protein [Bacteroidales bacterium]